MACFRAWAMDGTNKKQPLKYDGLRLVFADYLEATKAVLEVSGNAAEQQRNMEGTEVEQQRNADGSPRKPVELRWKSAELRWKLVEPPRNRTEPQRNKRNYLNAGNCRSGLLLWVGTLTVNT